MKTLKILLSIFLILEITFGMIADTLAETRTLTTTIIITVKAPDTQSALAPKGLEGLYNVALSQSQGVRLIKVEDPVYTPSGLPRYTMTERL